MSEQTAEAPFSDIIRGLRDHYEQVSTKACSWASGIGHAIDAYEREPKLKTERDNYKAALEELRDDHENNIALRVWAKTILEENA